MESQTEDTLRSWLALFSVPRLPLKLSHQLLKVYKTPVNLFMVPEQTLRSCGIKSDALDALTAYRKDPNNSPIGRRVLASIKWRKLAPNHHIIHWSHPRYPQALREIAQPPLILFVIGNVTLLNYPQLAIVGSRSPSHDGIRLAKQFAAHLSQKGLIITSGLARGIDAASHTGALSASMPTIAVMATGIDQIYPRKHDALAEQIKHNGALISDFPLGAAPRAQHFPQRNRIISGLSLGVLVIEAAIKSGSLITARFALEQNREVFAIPGSIHNPTTKGCHFLIRQGAKLVETEQHVLEELCLQEPLFAPHPVSQLDQLNLQEPLFAPHPVSQLDQLKSNNKVTLNKQQSLILDKIGFEPVPIDLLLERTELLITELSATLTELVLMGLVESTERGFNRIFVGS